MISRRICSRCPRCWSGDDVEVLTARSGAEALELLLVHDVALAFLDVQMPEMDGFELAELMRGSERTRHIPIIFVTAGRARTAAAVQGLRSGRRRFHLQADRAAHPQEQGRRVLRAVPAKAATGARIAGSQRDAAPQRDVQRAAGSRPTQSLERDSGVGSSAAAAHRGSGFARNRRENRVQRKAHGAHDRRYARSGARAPGRRHHRQARVRRISRCWSSGWSANIRRRRRPGASSRLMPATARVYGIRNASRKWHRT